MAFPAKQETTAVPTASASRFDLDALEFQSVRDLVRRYLCSALGMTCVEEMAPLRTRDACQRALDQAREMALALRRGDRIPQSGFLDVRPWVALLAQNRHTPDGKDLAELRKGLGATGRVRLFLTAQDPAELPELVRLGGKLPDFQPFAEELERIVDDGGRVLSTASPRLMVIRADLERAEDALRVAADRLLADRDLRKYLQTSEVAWRNGRPVVQVKLEFRRHVPGILHDRSQSGQTVFVEPEALVDYANTAADLRADEHRETQVILAETTRKVLARLPAIQEALGLLAWFDFTLARGRLVAERGFLVPALAQDHTLRVRGARHPLLFETHADPTTIVPLDLDLGAPHHMLVVTGPNTGGKTVAIKTVGLLACMALSGLPVPAAVGTAFPFLDGVFVDIGDEQEITQSLSTFSSHMTRIVRCLTASTERSLILIDELGAGTDPEEGGALGYAILEELHRRRVLTMATTHLGRLKEFAYAHKGAENGAMAFDPRSLRPLYRLDVGLPGASNALHIAAQVGLLPVLVERARALLGTRDRHVEEMIDKIQVTRMAAEAEKRRTEELARQAGQDAEKLSVEREELERRRQWLQEEADHLLEAELKTARGLLETPLREFANAPQPYGRKALDLLDALGLLFGKSSVGRRRLQFLEHVQKGDTVYVPRYRRRCIVQKLDRQRRRLHVVMGGMKTEIDFDDVSWLQPLDDE